MPLLSRAVVSDDSIVKKEFLFSGQLISLFIALIGLPLIAICSKQRWQEGRKRGLNWASFTLLSTYFFSFAYVFTMTVLIHADFSLDINACDATILTCLTLYVMVKAAGIAFLIERAYIMSWPVSVRHKTPEYVWTVLIISIPYIVALALCIYSRVKMFSEYGICVIGLKMYALLMLIVVEVGAYCYLTLRFLYPLVSLHFGGNGLLLPLRGVVKRTVIGTAITTLSTLGVKVMLTMFNGEPAWLCCMTCKFDAVLHTIVLHWITRPEISSEVTTPVSPQVLGIEMDENNAPTTNSQSSSGKSCAKEVQRELSLRDML